MVDNWLLIIILSLIILHLLVSLLNRIRRFVLTVIWDYYHLQISLHYQSQDHHYLSESLPTTPPLEPKKQPEPVEIPAITREKRSLIGAIIKGGFTREGRQL